ncbi:MAG: hypothetical protein ACD_5C00019G0001, partial [uncultured bacterium]
MFTDAMNISLIICYVACYVAC